MDAERLAALAELLARAGAAAEPGHSSWVIERDELSAAREARA